MAKNAAGAEGGHEPVLLAEVVEALAPVAGGRFVDGTFGAGGYARALLEAGAGVCGIDRDPDAASFAAPLAEQNPEKFQFVAG
jgi:16S rRNA (cytosine1402-N4)-methyltransferase